MEPDKGANVTKIDSGNQILESEEEINGTFNESNNNNTHKNYALSKYVNATYPISKYIQFLNIIMKFIHFLNILTRFIHFLKFLKI